MRPRWLLSWVLAYPLLQALTRLRVNGRRLLPAGPAILVANHITNVDPLVLGIAAARELHFLAKEELFRASPLFSWLIRSFNAWPVRRGGADAGAIRQCSRLLQRGRLLVLFPEGTRSQTGEIAKFMPGAAMLAITNRAPLVPCRILGLDHSWLSWVVDRDMVRRGYRTTRSRFGGVEVRFGPPVAPQPFEQTRAGYEEMTAAIEQRVRALA